MVDVKQVWSWLESVPDPEIPAVSVVDLGIVRDVNWQGNELVVTVTPTYSGCPATTVIGRDIVAALRGHGLTDVRLETRLSPPWSSEWVSAKGREQLRQFGIASGPSPVCPRCGAAQTERLSQFGSTPCKALYRCQSCREPFDYFKPF
ncbi:MAG TPA: 1,2-phenylacetyl-CoA epoxidase subunit PaaD [Terriglobales bacterium]|nr:1,2-phenylacetyl-CoA epoxidase subunit PaaD [Terriglobales bacterium]